MIKTLIIIGAGGSKNIHKSFPTGIELAHFVDVHLISTKKTTHEPTCPYISPMINEAFRVFKHEVKYLDELIDKLKIELWAYARKYDYHSYRTGAEPISIDELISSKFSSVPDIYNLAKQCLAYYLKGQEDAYLDTVNKTSSSNDLWIEKIYDTLKSQGASFNDIKNNLSVVSFNYERLFEYLSCKAINKLYNEVFTELPFINYIYGNFGSLTEVPFDTKNDSDIFRKNCHENLKLIGERHNLSNKPNLDNYKKVLFVGFGYDKDNLKDTLSIESVKTAKLIGMCRKLNSSYSKVETDFKIKMVECGDKIDEFITGQL
jgi:ribosomal protein L20